MWLEKKLEGGLVQNKVICDVCSLMEGNNRVTVANKIIAEVCDSCKDEVELAIEGILLTKPGPQS